MLKDFKLFEQILNVINCFATLTLCKLPLDKLFCNNLLFLRNRLNEISTLSIFSELCTQIIASLTLQIHLTALKVEWKHTLLLSEIQFDLNFILI